MRIGQSAGRCTCWNGLLMSALQSRMSQEPPTQKDSTSRMPSSIRGLSTAQAFGIPPSASRTSRSLARFTTTTSA
jgi:hypothetical protein